MRGVTVGTRRWIDAHATFPPDVRSAVKRQPAEVISQPLVVKYELANCVRELVALPSALESPCGFGFFARRGSSGGLDRIGGRTELVRNGRGLASSVGGMSCCPTEVSGRAHYMSAGRTSLHHLYSSSPRRSSP
jgi:hypothetical protein